MILKERQIKKKHHYVWDHYIRRWSNDDKNVWHTTSKGNISYNSTKGLAREDHFYRVNEITDQEAKIIKRISSKSPEYLHKQHLSYLNGFLELQKIETVYLDSGKTDRMFEEMMNVRRNNMIENLHY